jgi:hypothetical protein
MTAEVKAIERGAQPAVRLADGKTLNASTLVVAAGAWSAHLARCIGDRALLESERGYNMTYPAQGMSLRQQLIFAERKFVATPLEIGLRIGGAAEFAGLTAPANYERSHALVRAARRYMPSIPEEGGILWMGQRPSTPDSLPVIGPSPQSPQVIYAFGHGHLGLTQSATTGRLVADLVARPLRHRPLRLRRLVMPLPLNRRDRPLPLAPVPGFARIVPPGTTFRGILRPSRSRCRVLQGQKGTAGGACSVASERGPRAPVFVTHSRRSVSSGPAGHWGSLRKSRHRAPRQLEKVGARG